VSHRPPRAEFLAACRALKGVPYRWGGKSARGLDCSGLVTWVLHCLGGPDLRQTHNSGRLWYELPETIEPIAGDLAFFGPRGDPVHVVVCLGGPHEPIIGANGGGRATLTVADADRDRAEVKSKGSPGYRRDLLGYRRNVYLADPVAPPLEPLATLEHLRWAGWMEYLFTRGKQEADGSFTIDAGSVARWRRQVATPYADLSEREKESDRIEARKSLALLGLT
jgi:murein DD-endopeptidase